MKKKWVAYGLDMSFDYVIVETEGSDAKESHDKAIEILKQNEVDFDTVEPFDVSFLKRIGVLNQYTLEELLSQITPENRHKGEVQMIKGKQYYIDIYNEMSAEDNFDTATLVGYYLYWHAELALEAWLEDSKKSSETESSKNEEVTNILKDILNNNKEGKEDA